MGAIHQRLVNSTPLFETERGSYLKINRHKIFGNNNFAFISLTGFYSNIPIGKASSWIMDQIQLAHLGLCGNFAGLFSGGMSKSGSPSLMDENIHSASESNRLLARLCIA